MSIESKIIVHNPGKIMVIVVKIYLLLGSTIYLQNTLWTISFVNMK